MSQLSVPWTVTGERPQVRYGRVARMIIAPARGLYSFFGPVVARFPGMVMLGAVVGTCFAVWFHALVFAYVDAAILAPSQSGQVQPGKEAVSVLAPSKWGIPPSTIRELIDRRGGLVASFQGLLQYLLWPLQFRFVRDLVILGGIFGLFNLIPVYAIWWERKVAGRIQSRLGPMRVGGWHGWSQSIADGIKLVFKEDLVPKDADAALYRAAPYLALIPTIVAFVALPFGTTYVFRELDVALVFILGVLGVEVVGVIVAGWASNNKWSVYGAMREACQMVSYEIPMGMALLVPVVSVGSLSLSTVADAQSGGWFTWQAFNNPFTFGAFVCYFIASLAYCKRAPFDLPEAESELVAGFHTEYSGLRWSLFFFAEYAAMFVVSALAAILFLGGWHSPLPVSWGASWGDGLLVQGLRGLLFDGPIWLMAKAVFFLYVQMWLRWTLPRIRIDQVLYSCVQVMLPFTMLLLFGTTLWVWASTSESTAWALFATVVNVILGGIGIVFVLGFIGIAAFGFYHRRRLVGNLVVDPLPGA